MGERSDDLNRRFDADSAIDDAWTTGSPAHNDRTTHGLVIDPAPVAPSSGLRTHANHDRTTIGFGAGPVASITHDRTTNATDAGRIAADVVNAHMTAADDEHEQTGLAVRADSEHDRTTIHGGADRPPRALTDPLVASLDQAISELDGASGRAPGSRTFTVRGSEGVTVPLAEERKLVQPERSPLAFVIRDEPSAAPQTDASGDSSRVVMSLVGDGSPAVESEASVIPTMQPVLRRARLRRRWIAGALVATAVVGAFAMKLTASKAPKAPAAEAAKAESAVPAAAPAPTPTPPPPPSITPELPKPSVVPEMATTTEPPAPAEAHEVVGIATTSSPKPSAKLTTAKTTVATHEATAKSSTKKPSTPKNKSIAMTKSSTARKSATAKKKPAPANESSWKRPQRSF